MVKRFVNWDIQLKTVVAPTKTFPAMFLTDDDSVVPLHRRYIITTRLAYEDDLPAGTEPRGFAQDFWSQSRSADKLYVGLWAKTALPPVYVTGATKSLTLSDWTAVTDGTFTVRDNAGTPNEDDLTGLNFSTATSVTDIETILTAAIQAIAVPNITGLDTAVFEFNNVGELVLRHSLSGAAAATLTIVSEGTGTDLTGASFFDIANGATIAGIDAEEPTDAVTAIRDLNDEWYKMSLRNESAAQQQALAAQFESLSKQLTLVNTETDAKNPASTTDVPYILKSLGYDNVSSTYTEHDINATGGRVDAVMDGACLPGTEGSIAWSNERLKSVFSSGKDAFGNAIELTATEVSALEGKNCNWIASTTVDTFATPGLNASGNETRIILLKHWMENELESRIFTYNLDNTPFFDDTTLAAYEGITQAVVNEAFERGGLVDTEDRPITVVFPLADDFTAADRASHTMTLDNVFSAYITSVVNRLIGTGELRI
jgi:hypothetical protein